MWSTSVTISQSWENIHGFLGISNSNKFLVKMHMFLIVDSWIEKISGKSNSDEEREKQIPYFFTHTKKIDWDDMYAVKHFFVSVI